MKRALWIALGALTGLFVLIALVFGTASEPSPQKVAGERWLKPHGTEQHYAGSQTCARCHAREAATFFKSPHAHTVTAYSGGRRPEFGLADHVTDEGRGTTYSVHEQGGAPVFAAQTGSSSQIGSPKWVFGSGVQAWTYMDQTAHGFLEYRISYYPPVKHWTFTPGQGPRDEIRAPLGQPYTPVEAAACFGCHSTVLVGNDKGLDLQKSHLNVGCESCHGPGKAHADAAAAGPGGTAVPVPVPKGTSVMESCGQCHRLPPNGGDATNPIVEDQLARFPGIALERSKCFRMSNGKLNCVTCHDPHRSAETNPSVYDRTCISCHTPPTGTPCTSGKTSLCVSCHMPVQTIGRKLPLRFHLHWIRAGLNG